jgi:hypothetical protein
MSACIGLMLGNFHFFVRTVSSKFWGKFWKSSWFFFFLISHSKNHPNFLLKKNPGRQFSRSTNLTKFWTPDFQRQFSQVDYHKSRFFVFYISIFTFFWGFFVFFLL